jgi:hypothetical protein
MKLSLFFIAVLTTVVLAVLKLVEVGTYTWTIVFMPMFIWLALLVLLLAFFAVLAILALRD